MLALHRKVPCTVGLLFMEGEPTYYHSQLLTGHRSSQRLAVKAYGCFVIPIVCMHMGLVVLSRIFEQHVDDDSGEAA